ncbi:MAG: VOC family protein [Chloroflexi bacterium]|nr:VOC family protein [Chloroflexota bacterium]
MAITGLVHVNINCSDFERSRAFYQVLGFERLLEVAPTSTPEVAAAVGMPPYALRGALMILRGTGQPLVIDLLEWRDPRDDSPPYRHLYHLGIARVALATDDLDAEMARLKAHGVEFLSEPATVALPGAPVSSRFVCFKDPDGTILELVEST